ncbi:hypothetical protein [Burkholderia ubonensis]|uniref:hypothetical protein n=1 Tax=Burkholderia ubonensis TaxID=101571 RepID=UPI000B17790D|nr:hypothetical protein [Burkholderia ubonensis]
MAGWYRHITFALLARAVLITFRSREKSSDGIVPLSVNEICCLLCRLAWRVIHPINFRNGMVDLASTPSVAGTAVPLPRARLFATMKLFAVVLTNF